MKSFNQEREVLEEYKKLPKMNGWVVKRALVEALAKRWNIALTSVYFHLERCLSNLDFEEIIIDRVKYIKILGVKE